MRVQIDRSGCIACGLCVDTCPEVFRIAEDGLAEVYTSPSDTDMTMVREAANGCPVSVIKVDE